MRLEIDCSGNPGLRLVAISINIVLLKNFPYVCNNVLFKQVFDRVREMGDDWKRKIVPVEGDIAEENLGISDEEWKMLQEGVEVVFHSAATVRFDEDLK